MPYVFSMYIVHIYFFLSSWAGGILQILQSDWFREWAHRYSGSFHNHLLGFRKKIKMLFAIQGRSVVGKTVLSVLCTSLGRPRARFFLIWTSHLENNIYLLSTIWKNKELLQQSNSLNPSTPKIWLLILSSSCYTFPSKLVWRIWCLLKITTSA